MTNNTRVLIIDDEEIIRLTICQFFITEGYECDSASNGLAGLKLFEQQKPDIVFVDLRLPDISGLDVLARITEMDKETPVIMISGAGGIDDALEAIRCGAWDYIVKPFSSLEALLYAQNKALERQELLRENRKYREHLEAMVASRTAELEQTNERLTGEIENRRRAEKALQDAYDDMEDQVRERTQDLKLANEQLEREIQERSIMQDALIRSERLAAVGTLAGGVAHEFNNINVTVLGFSELLLQRDGLDEEMQTGLERIKNGALRAKKITTSLLTFADIRKPQTALFSISQITREVLQIIELQFRSIGIMLTVNLAEMPKCRMDKGQISQIVMNFLTNARDAVLHKKPKKIGVTTEQRGEFVCVTVTDNGCGIPEKYVTNLFTPFFSTKGEHSLRRGPMSDVKGVGLGLSVSHTIARNHGGDIQIVSTEGEGSSFSLLLPIEGKDIDLSSSNVDIQRVNATAYTGKQHATVLVLDDEADTLELVETSLGRKGHTVLTTDDGETAFRILRESVVDLVLVDLQMPKMPGRIFIQRLQELPPVHRPHVTIITGRTYDTEVEAYSDTFDLDVMQKPFSLQNLDRLVESVLSERREAVR